MDVKKPKMAGGASGPNLAIETHAFTGASDIWLKNRGDLDDGIHSTNHLGVGSGKLGG